MWLASQLGLSSACLISAKFHTSLLSWIWLTIKLEPRNIFKLIHLARFLSSLMATSNWVKATPFWFIFARSIPTLQSIMEIALNSEVVLTNICHGIKIDSGLRFSRLFFLKFTKESKDKSPYTALTYKLLKKRCITQ
jgi:hypothetical protein